MNSKVLLIYTGGTIGMNRNPKTGALEPFDFEHLLHNVPELKEFDCQIDTYQFFPPIDSSDMTPAKWTELSHIIADNYEEYEISLPPSKSLLPRTTRGMPECPRLAYTSMDDSCEATALPNKVPRNSMPSNRSTILIWRKLASTSPIMMKSYCTPIGTNP